MSPYNKSLLKQYSPRDYQNKRYKSRKLLGTFYDRKKYVVHLENLQYYLQKGIELKKIRRIVKFKQKPFLKDFIELVTSLRSKARNDFELRLFKLFANATFGKFIENVRNYLEVKLCGTEKQLRMQCLGQHVSSFNIINENLVAVNRKPATIKLNKPLAVGFSILELSKLFMYRSYYDLFKKHFGTENISLLFSDTDSFLFQIKCNNLETEKKKLKHIFDFSKYPKTHPLFDQSKANQLFLFKDELKGTSSITHFIGLRPKCYSMKVSSLKDSNQQDEKKVCKGLKKSSIKNQLSFSDYENCLNNATLVYKSFKSLKSKNHRIRTCYQRKIALSAMDTKRHILSCGIHTISLGSCYINQNEMTNCSICK